MTVNPPLDLDAAGAVGARHGGVAGCAGVDGGERMTWPAVIDDVSLGAFLLLAWVAWLIWGRRK